MAKKPDKKTQIDFGSYSDLFMVMAFVFLFMYVVATLNNGITLIQERHRAQAATKDLQEKIAVYEKKIDDALTEEQKREYEELRLGLEQMKDEAREARLEQERLAKLAEEKEKNLTKYQSSIKTMAVIQARANEEIKSKITELDRANTEAKEQNRAIASLNDTLEEKSKELSQLSNEVKSRESEITKIQSRVTELSSKAILARKQSLELDQLKSDLVKKEQELRTAKQTEESILKEKEQLAQASKNELEQITKSKDEQISTLEAKYKKATAGLRKEIAGSLASKLSEKGIFADVDKATGDVTVRFTNAYFDYNSSSLKDEMKKELESFIPIYAKSLFENKKFASAISSIEIVGSASPSYNGRYINPRAIASEEERKAVNYNLDLSYRRAKNIFEHTFFSKNFKFEHREEMMPVVKVVGTGYLQALDELKELPNVSQVKEKGFCGVYNCQTYQKVTLKFNLKDKNVQQ